MKSLSATYIYKTNRSVRRLYIGDCNIIQPILGLSELLSSRTSDPKQRQLLDVIVRASRFLQIHEACLWSAVDNSAKISRCGISREFSAECAIPSSAIS